MTQRHVATLLPCGEVAHERFDGSGRCLPRGAHDQEGITEEHPKNKRSAADNESERKEESALFARMNTLEGSPERLDDALRSVREQVLPRLRQQDGFKGLMFLANYRSGELQLMSFWESAQTMRASEGEADRLRAEVAEAGDQEIARVERYDVVLFEAPS